MADLKVGDRVWYWARRRGETPRQEHGKIVQMSGEFSRVRLNPYVDGERAVPVQTVEVKRLHKEESNAESV